MGQSPSSAAPEAPSTPPTSSASTSASPLSNTSPSPSHPQPNPAPPSRLGLRLDQRLLLSTLLALLTGYTLSYASTSRLAALRFRAENAHRLPRSTAGWYLYHKSKSYYAMRHGITAGLRSGARLAGWSLVFMGLEEGVDGARGRIRSVLLGSSLWGADGGEEMREEERTEEERTEGRKGETRGKPRISDAFSSCAAGLGTAGLWAGWQGFARAAATRTLLWGGMGGLAYGGLQDGLAMVRRSGLADAGDGESWIYRGAKNRKLWTEEQRQAREGPEKEG